MARQDAGTQLNAALQALETALRDTLAEAARQSVDDTLKRLSAETRPLAMRDVEVEIVIKQLSLESRTRAGGGSRSKRRPARRSSGGGTGARGRPAGRIRTALVEVFASEPDAMLDAEALRSRLSAQGIEPTTDNLHQHLARLVKAGELERAGRGLYRRAAA